MQTDQITIKEYKNIYSFICNLCCLDKMEKRIYTNSFCYIFCVFILYYVCEYIFKRYIVVKLNIKMMKYNNEKNILDKKITEF